MWEAESPDDYGYVLIGNDFVSFEFINKVKQNLQFNPLAYGPIIDAETMVLPEFWDSLDCDERAVVGPCLLILIGNGGIKMRDPNAALPTISD
jgi:hypothetical protein